MQFMREVKLRERESTHVFYTFFTILIIFDIFFLNYISGFLHGVFLSLEKVLSLMVDVWREEYLDLQMYKQIYWSNIKRILLHNSDICRQSEERK